MAGDSILLIGCWVAGSRDQEFIEYLNCGVVAAGPQEKLAEKMECTEIREFSFQHLLKSNSHSLSACAEKLIIFRDHIGRDPPDVGTYEIVIILTCSRAIPSRREAVSPMAPLGNGWEFLICAYPHYSGVVASFKHPFLL